MKMDYKNYLYQLELVNQEIGHFEHVLDQYDEIMFNPFSRKARWRRAIIRKLRELEREIGALNYRFHGDESFPNPVDFASVMRNQDAFREMMHDDDDDDDVSTDDHRSFW